MKRRLWLLNLALAGALGLEWMQFARMKAEFEQRAARNLNQPIRPERAPALPALPKTEAVVAANYADVAVKTLFSRDRNPTVIPDAPAPAPPQKPMPPLPLAYGAMYWGEPRIILGLQGSAGQRSYRKGETIGDFTLLDFDRQTIAFEWEGKRVERRLDEVMVKPSQAAPAQAPQQAAAAPPPKVTTTTVTAPAQASGPGADVGGGFRSCAPGDNSPSGTVRDGYRKVSASTPFGTTCRWEPAK